MSAARITYVGHATVLLEIGATRLLTDPVLGARLLHIRRHAPPPAPEVTAAIDAVLISHLHHDHLDFASLRRLGKRTPIIAPAGAGRTLRRRGYRAVTELAVGETATVGAAAITATPARHEGRRLKLGPAVDAVGFAIAGAGRRLYFAGDTDLFDEMAALGELDVAMLPIAGWGPRVGKGHLDPRSAARAAALLRPRIAVPIHWGTLLRIGLTERVEELLERPARRFVAELAAAAPQVEAAVLEPGEALEL